MMSKVKDLYMSHVEEEMEKLMEANPDMDPSDAYDKVTNTSYDSFRDYMADLADSARQRSKDG